jgi:hypothetical protein
LEAPRFGSPKRWYFDVETGLLLRVDEITPEGKVFNREDYQDYRAVAGEKVPFMIRQFKDGLETVTTLTEVKHNVRIDDSRFEKPATKASAGRPPEHYSKETD